MLVLMICTYVKCRWSQAVVVNTFLAANSKRHNVHGADLLSMAMARPLVSAKITMLHFFADLAPFFFSPPPRSSEVDTGFPATPETVVLSAIPSVKLRQPVTCRCVWNRTPRY